MSMNRINMPLKDVQQQKPYVKWKSLQKTRENGTISKGEEIMAMQRMCDVCEAVCTKVWIDVSLAFMTPQTTGSRHADVCGYDCLRSWLTDLELEEENS